MNIDIKKDIILAPHTTFKIGGLARFFTVIKIEKEMITAVTWAKKNKLPFFVLGKGANVLISDQGFAGLVIKNEMRKLEIKNQEITAESGINLSELISECIKNGISGLEFLAGVPSTVGGAIVGNAGSKTRAIGDYVKTVKILDKNLHMNVLNKNGCQFAYRQSIFKNIEAIILSAVFQLEKGNAGKLTESVKNLIKMKKETQDLEHPSAGCAFKNPEGQSAGKIIEELGLKGKKIGQAQVSEKHANYIINLGGAKADHVVQLISLIKQQVRDKKRIQLQEEIRYVGFSQI